MTYGVKIRLLAFVSGMIAVGLAPAAAQIPVPVYSWTGFYVGAHAGYGWGRQTWDQTSNNQGNPNDTTSSALRLDGFLGGVQAGYDFHSNRWVYGLQGAWSWTGANGCAGNVIFSQYESCSKANWYATATTRVGYAFERSLVFVRGGAAFTGQKHSSTFLGAIDTEETRNITTGWTLGGGIEHAFAPNWSVSAEYAFMDFGKKDTPLSYLDSGSSPGLRENWNVNFTVHMLKVGINYRFGMGQAAAR